MRDSVMLFLLLNLLAFPAWLKTEFSPAVLVGVESVDVQDWYSVIWVEGESSALLPEFFRLSADMDLQLFKGEISGSLRVQNGENIPFTNLPRGLALNAAFIDRAYLNLEFDGLKITLGRKKRKFGPLVHQIALSENVPYFDGLDVHLPGPVDFYYSLYSLDPFLTEEEKKVQENTVCINADRSYSEPVKIYQMHGLGFEIYGLRFNVREVVLIGGKYPSLIELNPILPWHFLYKEGYMNSQFDADFVYEKQNLKIYGELLVDDIALPLYEDPTVKPTALAYGIGAEFHGVFVEYIHTDDWVYIREVPYMRFDTRILRITNTRYYEDYPIGFEYGPGVDLLSLGGAHKLGGFHLKWDVNFFIKKDVHMYSTYKEEITKDPTFNFKLNFELKNDILSFKGSWGDEILLGLFLNL